MPLITDYRPTTFDEIAALKSIKKLLNKKQFPHAWPFVGNSDVGKTPIARIVAEKFGAPEAI